MKNDLISMFVGLKNALYVFFVDMFKPNSLTLNGVRFLGLRSIGVSAQVVHAIAKGTYEYPEYYSIIKNLMPDDRVLEIGSGLGYITMQCAKIVGDRNIITFEASPGTANIAKDNFKINGFNIKLETKILSDKPGSCLFHVCDNFESSSCIDRQVAGHVIEVECVDVNEVIKEFNPTFLVMDLEGGEADLVPKMLLIGVSKISIEMHPHIIGDDAVSEIIAHFLRQGFLLDLSSTQKKVMCFYKK